MRNKMRLSQVKLAEAIGVDSNTISRWERDLYRVTADYVPKLASILNTSVAYLMGEVNDPELGQRVSAAVNSAIASDNAVVAQGAATINTAVSESSIVVEHGEGANKTRVVLPAGTPGDVVAQAIKSVKESSE
jgi:transcriptional regulator with XRE-family HTH domain